MKPACNSINQYLTHALLGLVVLSEGCSDQSFNTTLVSGRVTYNGEALVGGGISFFPVDRGNGRPARTKINEDGTFEVKTLTDTPGLVPGTYRVSVALMKAPLFGATPEQLAAAKANPMELPKHFSNPETSGLEFTVNSNKKRQIYNIDLVD